MRPIWPSTASIFAWKSLHLACAQRAEDRSQHGSQIAAPDPCVRDARLHRCGTAHPRLNHQSRRAIERLGAKLDGILRNHQRARNGTLRDTVVYSIIESEWPTFAPTFNGSLTGAPALAPLLLKFCSRDAGGARSEVFAAARAKH